MIKLLVIGYVQVVEVRIRTSGRTAKNLLENYLVKN